MQGLAFPGLGRGLAQAGKSTRETSFTLYAQGEKSSFSPFPLNSQAFLKACLGLTKAYCTASL